MTEVDRKLDAFWKAFEAIETMVLECDKRFGVRLINPRELLLYRRRVEPFVDAVTQHGTLSVVSTADLWDALDHLTSPDVWVEGLQMGGIKGPGLAKFKALARALAELQRVAWRQLELGDR
jgi:hypothetical protein